MNFLKKYSLLWFIMLFFSFQNCWAMGEEDDDDGYRVLHNFTKNRKISYKKGDFGGFILNNNKLFTEPHNPIFSISECMSKNEYNRKPQILTTEINEKLLKRVNQNKDGRLPVETTVDWPYRIHGQLTMVYGEQNEYGGSGVLIGPHHVLTAGHCVYDFSKREWANSVSVYFGLNENSVPFEKTNVVKAYTFKQWKDKGDKDYDLALLLLDSSIGRIIGWSGIGCSMNEEALGMPVTITGYPADKGFTKMMTMTHNIKTTKHERFYYDIDTYGGQSGGGIWVNTGGFSGINPYVVGIHTCGEESPGEGNSGVRLSTNKFMQIVNWIDNSFIASVEDSVPPSSPLLLTQEYRQMEMFLKAKLVYRPNPNSTEGIVNLPIAKLQSQLEDTFDLSNCDDMSKYFSISTGYRKGVNPANRNKYEIWIVPRVLISKELQTTAQYFQAVFNIWHVNAPIGIFWTWGEWNDSTCYDYLISQTPESLPKSNLFEKFSNSHRLPHNRTYNIIHNNTQILISLLSRFWIDFE